MHFRLESKNPKIDGFEKYYDANDKVKTPSGNGLSSGNISDICEDKDGKLWISTQNGLTSMNIFSEKFNIYRKDEHFKKSLNNNKLTCLHSDNSGIIWIGTYGSGINKLDLQNQAFKTIAKIPRMKQTLVDNNVSAVWESSNGVVWIGTGKGLNTYNKYTDEFHLYKNEKGNLRSLRSNSINCIFESSKGELWIGHGKGISIYNRATDDFKHLVPNRNNPNTLIGGGINSIFEDKSGIFWIGSSSGFCSYNPLTNSFQHFYHDPENPFSLSYNNVSEVLVDHNENIWIATRGKGLNTYSRTAGTFKRYQNDRSDKFSLSDDMVICLFEDRDGRVWVGTKQGGVSVFNENTDQFTTYRETDGLASNWVFSIEQDNKGNLWFSTNCGLSRFNPSTKEFKNFTLKDGLQGNEFKRRSSCKNRKGEIYFGGANGLNFFNPYEVKPNPYQPIVVLTAFELDNHIVVPGENSILEKDIAATERIELDYSQNTFIIEFSALHFARPENNEFAYRLEGFNDEWIYTSAKRRFAAYTDLDYGKYTFIVKACNNDGVWNEEGRKLTIIVKPPFWKTWWFRGLIITIIALSAYGIFRASMNRIRRQRLESLVEERTRELKEKNEEINHQNEEMMTINEQLSTQHDELLQKNEMINQQNEEVKMINDQLQSQKSELETKNEQILTQRDQLQVINLELAEQKKNIESSIRYAKTIQEAILPTISMIKESFNDSFIIFKPKDIVSGDFYWYSQVGRKAIFAVVDCTGHGVPGAFMSLVGHTLLKEIILQREHTDPATILTELNKGVIAALKQDVTSNDDGMDVCMVSIEEKDGEFEVDFGGAKRPLWYLMPDSTEVQTMNGDNISIGGIRRKKSNKSFETKGLVLPKDSILYLSSDGYADQNNQNRIKFGSQRLKDFLFSIRNMEVNMQKARLLIELDEHQGTSNQRDDISMIALKLR